MTDSADPRRKLEELSPDQRALVLRRLVERRRQSPAGKEDLPAVEDHPEERFESFPLTPLQQAYWVGRTGAFEMGSVAAHSYLEIETTDLDPDRLAAAWRRLVDRHEMLRAVVDQEGRQRILPEVPAYEIEVHDLSAVSGDEARKEVEALRARMSHQVYSPDRWPLFEVRLARLPDGALRLFVSLDALIADGWSHRVLLEEWATLARNPDAELPPIEVSFRDYVMAVQDLEETEAYERDRRYWMERLDDLPSAPDLPLRASASAPESPRFVRRVGELGAERWTRIRERASRGGLTPTGVLLAAYADVLSLWSQSRHFLLSVPSYNRLPLHPHVGRVVGEFSSFTVLEVDNRQGGDFRERAGRHQARLWEDLSHDRFDGVAVVRQLARTRDRSTSALLPVIFTSMPDPRDVRGDAAPGDAPYAALGKLAHAINQTSQVWMDNHVSEVRGGLRCDFDTVDEVLPPGVPAAVLEAFMSHLRRLADDERWWETEWAEVARELLPDEQRERRARVNSKEAPIPERLVHDPLARWARREPDRVAVVTSERTLTYGEMDRLSNRWARALRQAGMEAGELVPVVMEKGWEQAVAALAVLKAGGAYVPLDPDDPPRRLEALVERCGGKQVLVQPRTRDRAEWSDTLVVHPVEWIETGPEDADAPDVERTPDDLALVIFTSGSTGRPKGVMIEHRGLVNALEATRRRFEVSRDDRVLAVTALHHDMSLFDLFGVLGAGGRIVIPDHDGRRDPAHWSELVAREGITVWNSVPAMMQMLLEYLDRNPTSLNSLRLAFLGGDWIPVDLPDRLRAGAGDLQVVSVGGPTETTLWNIWHPVDEVDPSWPSIPYGTPIPNTRYHVLDDLLVDRPDWVPGEMWVSGAGLARGYLDDSETTDARFRRHPESGERIYRTGDLGRYRPDGTLEFLGRADFQVQIGGQRIELGEIEAALREHDAVGDVVAAAAGPERGPRTLAAYLVADPALVPSDDELRSFLADRLPRHMIPRAFVTLDRLPLTRNGKVDRKALPEADLGAGASAEDGRAAAAAADPALVGRIRGIVEDVLGVDELEADARLLSYGANSIDLVKIGNRLEDAFGRRPRMDDLFRLQTVVELAGFYDEGGDRPPLPTASAPSLARDELPAGLQELMDELPSLMDPDQRETFKEGRPGIRRDLEDRPAVELASRPESAEARRARYRARRSHRTFSLRPVPAAAFGRFLESLSVEETADGPRYLYASGGGLYPNQVYVHVKPGRVEGVDAGTHYYDPERHRLVTIRPGAAIERDIHVPFVNQPTYDEAAFSIFIVAQLRAMVPSYGRRSLHFVALEAGIMAHHLEMAAAREAIGLCQIGSVEFERIRELFDLDEGHFLVHSLLGGRPREGTVGRPAGAGARVEEMMTKVEELSDDEVRALLEAEAAGEGGEPE